MFPFKGNNIPALNQGLPGIPCVSSYELVLINLNSSGASSHWVPGLYFTITCVTSVYALAHLVITSAP